MNRSLIPWPRKSPLDASVSSARNTRDLIAPRAHKLIAKPEWSDLENPAARFPCCVVADTSGSMDGNPINRLNAGLRDLGEYVRKDALAARSAEICVVKGNQPFLDKSQRSWIEAKRTGHSSKPEVVREIIAEVSPGPRLEMYGRKLPSNSKWTVYGNQLKH